MNKINEWNDLVNKRERKKQLEKLLTNIKEDITFAQLNKSKDDNSADLRLEVLFQDLKEIELELNTLDEVEEQYSRVLNERIKQISSEDEKSKQFFEGVEKALSGLNIEISKLNSDYKLLSNLKKQAEAMLKSVNESKIDISEAELFLRECEDILSTGFNVKPTQFGSDNNELYVWSLYQLMEELYGEVSEKMQVLIPQIIELNMRREEYISNYDE